MKEDEFANNKLKRRKNVPEYLLFAVELQALAVQSQQGDKKKYKEFLEKLVPHIRRYVQKSWWGDDNSIEDLVQDVMLAIHTNLHTYNSERPILPWVKTIVRYRISDYCRKFIPWNQKEIGAAEEIEENRLFISNDETEIFENADFIDRALAELPEQQAQIVSLLKIHGLSLQEVAELMGLSVASVKTYSHRANKKLVEFRINNK